MPRVCMMLDLKNDPQLIAEYRDWHQRVWPEVVESLKDSGIREMEIFLGGNRLFMVLDTVEGFSFAKKLKLDAKNPKVQEWEQLMWKFQQPVPGTPAGEKWQPTECVFKLSDA
jgi:L-rhamnose mutarotase